MSSSSLIVVPSCCCTTLSEHSFQTDTSCNYSEFSRKPLRYTFKKFTYYSQDTFYAPEVLIWFSLQSVLLQLFLSLQNDHIPELLPVSFWRKTSRIVLEVHFTSLEWQCSEAFQAILFASQDTNFYFWVALSRSWLDDFPILFFLCP